jgi:hypothetical protein
METTMVRGGRDARPRLTVVQIMLAVAIIGLLAAVAIRAFGGS